MDFTLSGEQLLIKETAETFARERIAPNALAWDRDRYFPVEVVRETAALGLGGMFVRPEHGGSGLSRVDAAVVFEALATGCPCVAAYISIHNMVAAIVDRHGSEAQRAHWLPDLVSMRSLASYCLTEPSAGSDAAQLQTKAVREGDHYRLSGTKQFISGAGDTDVYLVMARTGGEGARGISAFLVARDTAGLSFGANERKMGWNAQATRSVILDDVRVPAADRIGEEGSGFRVAMAGLDGGRLNIAACSLGGAQSAFDKALAYARERRAFGQELARFQALQFKLADMATALEASRTFLWRAASALDEGSPEATRLSAMAKRLCTDQGFEVANAALQLLGGYGYLADYGIEKIVRDLRVHQILEGTNEIMRVIVGRDLTVREG